MVTAGAWHDGLVKLSYLFVTVLFGALVACVNLPPPVESSTPAASLATLQTVPAEALSTDVRQETIQQTICVAGYTASVRPSTNYTNGVKLKLLRDQGLPASAASEFELDHRIPLALGGHPRNLQNLMLQRWEGEDGARVKDRLERRLQRMVCAGNMLLEDARRAIYLDWQAAYRSSGISQ